MNMPDITQPKCQYCGDTGIIKSNLGSHYCPGCNHAAVLEPVICQECYHERAMGVCSICEVLLCTACFTKRHQYKNIRYMHGYDNLKERTTHA